jgi:hypothetical protein
MEKENTLEDEESVNELKAVNSQIPLVQVQDHTRKSVDMGI